MNINTLYTDDDEDDDDVMPGTETDNEDNKEIETPEYGTEDELKKFLDEDDEEEKPEEYDAGDTVSDSE